MAFIDKCLIILSLGFFLYFRSLSNTLKNEIFGVLAVIALYEVYAASNIIDSALLLLKRQK